MALPILNKITLEMVKVLTGHVGALTLAVREDMSDEAIEALLKHEGPISGNDKILMLMMKYKRKMGIINKNNGQK